MLESGRVVQVVTLLLTTLLLSACGTPPEKAAADRLFLQTESGVAIVEPGAAQADFQAPVAVPSHDWSTVVRADRVRGSTNLVALDPESGEQRWTRSVMGNLNVKVVAEDGRRVALAPIRERYYLYGRRTTKLVLVGEGLPTTRTIELAGNFEPEAFSTDGQSLFVLQYRPARNPQSYQVRRLDLQTEEVLGVYTPDHHLQESMRGTARIQAASPDGTRLYTLYTVGRGEARRAFIHVLNLEELWAHCIDLPADFADAPESGIALTPTPDGDRLFVATAEGDSVAEIDTQQLSTIRSRPLALAAGPQTSALYGPEDTLFLASGTRLVMADASSLRQMQSWILPAPIRGLQMGAGGRLYVGLKNRIEMIDTQTGERVGELDPPGVKRIWQFGRAPRSLDDGLSKLTCAC